MTYGSKDRVVRIMGSELDINSMKENGYYRASRIGNTSSLYRQELPILPNLTHFVRPDGAFVDAGANVGIYATFFSKFTRLYPDFSVHAFEVSPNTFSRLNRNAERHGFTPYNTGLSARQESFEYTEGTVSRVTSYRKSEYSVPKNTFRAECKPLSDFPIPSDNIILKIDVEGQEFEVLKGATSLFEAGRIACVYLDGFSNPSVIHFLKDFNFKLFNGKTLEKATARSSLSSP